MTTSRAQSLGDRIRIASVERGVDAQRLRRGVVYQRLLVRAAGHGLVLKGGYCLEVRLGGAARSTKDLDLVGRLALASDPDDLADALDDVLAGPHADGFAFRAGVPKRLRAAEAGSPAWRVSVQALVDGAPFDRVVVDLVGQVDEVSGAVEMLRVPPPVRAPDHDPVDVQAVDVYQHAAEKLHAYARTYAGGRPSSRVKDLVDLVLLVEAGLLLDPARLAQRLGVVWQVRAGADPPPTLPSPPPTWGGDLARLLRDVGSPPLPLAAAHQLALDLYTSALDEGHRQ